MSTSVDPQQLLTALAPLLTSEGAMKNEAQVPRISGLMSGAKKLVSRCIYLNILRATTNEQLLTGFVSGGGWELLNTWLQEAKESNNIAFLTDLLIVFKQLPVTIDILKKNNTAKLVKQMSKTETNDSLKPLAEAVVSTWMKVIKQSHENSDTKPASTAPPVVKKKKIKKIVKKTSPKDGTPSAEEPSESDASGESVSKKLKPEDGSSSKTELDDSNERTKREKEAKKRLSAGSLPKSEKLSKVAENEDKTSKDDEKPSKDDEKPSKDDEKPRLGTVKRPAHTKFRSTGIEKESTLPPIKIKKKQPTESLPAINRRDKPIPLKREGPIFGKSLLPPEKKSKMETTPPSSAATTASTTKATPTSSSTTPTTSPAASTSSSSSTTNNVSRIKLIPPKHKFHESSIFMDALNAPAIPVRKIKPKKAAKPTSPTVNKLLDTPRGPLGAKEETQEETSETSQDSKPEPPKFRFYSSGQNGEEEAETSESKDEANSATKDNSSTTTGNLKLVPTKIKKCVQWKEEDKLVETFYFEMDETERENVNRPKDFRNAAHLEMMMEGETIKNAKLHGDDNGQDNSYNDLLPWRTPILIQLLDVPPVDYGCNSQEKAVQKQREMVVLQEIYFDKNMIPDTPKEPDPEPFEPKEPTRIPLEDEAADSSQGSTPLYSEPMSGHLPPQPPPPLLQGLQLHNLPPAIASLVQQMPGAHPHNMSPSGPLGHGGPPGEPPSPNATIANVQNLLDSIMGNQQGAVPPTQDELANKLRDMLEPFKNQLPGSLGPPQPNHLGPPNFHPEGWGPPGHGGPGPGPGPGMGPRFGGPGRGGFNPHFGGPLFPNGPGPFPGHDMGPRGPPRPPMRGGPWGRGGRGRGRGGMNFGNRSVCRNFMTPRGCDRGQTCRFIHPGVNGPPLKD